MNKGKRFSSCKFTIEEEKIIIEEYLNGIGTTTLGKKWNCNSTTIYNILKYYNIPRRSFKEARRNYLNFTLQEDYFEEINTKEKAYWLGFIYADGYISTTNKYTNYLGISLARKDKEHLEKFKQALKYNGEVKDYEVTQGYKIGSPYSRLLIGSNKLVEDLQKWGVVEHKTTKINQLPNITFLDDFIRGYIDGDGSLRKSYADLRICGNFDFLQEIANHFNIPYKIIPDKSIFDLCYRVKESHFLENYLYNNACCYLNRKYNIAKRSFIVPLASDSKSKP